MPAMRRFFTKGRSATIAAVLALAPGALADIARAAEPPTGLSNQQWQAIQTQIGEQVDAKIVAGRDPVDRGGGSSHDLIRTVVLAGDYTGLPEQSAGHGPEFGYSVAIDGDWLAVGAPGTLVDGGSEFGIGQHGAVFMFQRRQGGWQLRQRIVFANHGSAPRCGHAVALALPHLMIGCPDSGWSGNPAALNGLVRWYRLDAQAQWAGILASMGGDLARCGFAVALSASSGDDDSAVSAIGCPGSMDFVSQRSGLVKIRGYSASAGTWSHLSFVVPNDGTDGDRFGDSVALYRAQALGITVQRLAVGAPYKTHGPALAAGSVYVFAGSSWTQTAALTGPAPQSFALTYFGSSVAMNNTQLIVGARGGFTSDCGNAPRCGTVARFQRSGADWLLQEGGGAINTGGNPSGEQPGMAFGARVAIGADNWVAVAAPHADGWTQFDGVAEDVGMVELRRDDAGGWGVSWSDAQGEVRPGAIAALVLDHGQFGTGLDFSGRRLAVGYPRSGTAFPGGGRRGQVWIYDPDRIFADGFE